LSKNIYKYYYIKATSIGKSVYAKNDGAHNENVKTCVSKIYKIKPIEIIQSLSDNTFSTKMVEIILLIFLTIMIIVLRKIIKTYRNASSYTKNYLNTNWYLR